MKLYLMQHGEAMPAEEITVTVAFTPETVVCLERRESRAWSLNRVLRPDLLGG
jgi:hypothetical protein